MSGLDPFGSDGFRFDTDLARLRRIAETPLKNLRFSLWWIRKTFFTKQRSTTDSVIVARSKSELKELFGERFFEPGWETSYHYKNEILNYRRVEYDDEQSPPIAWWQTHIRGYPYNPGTDPEAGQVELEAHYEPEPVEHPAAHLSEQHIDVQTGMEAMQAVLDGCDIDYEYVDRSDG